MQTMEEKPKPTLRMKFQRKNGKWQLENKEKNGEADSMNGYCRKNNKNSVVDYAIKSDKYEDISDDEWNGANRHWTQGMIGDYIHECETLLHSAEVRWRQSSPLEELRVSDIESSAHVRPHRSEEIQDRLQESSDSEVDEDRMTSRELEEAAHRHAKALLRTLRRLTLRDEETCAIRNKYTPVLGQTSRSPPQDQDDIFVAGSLVLKH